MLEKTLESPLDCKEIHQSILKEISPGISLEEMMLKLKLQYFGHLMRRVDLPGSSPGGSRVIQRWGRSRHPGNNLFNYRYIERLETDSVVGRLVEKRG